MEKNQSLTRPPVLSCSTPPKNTILMDPSIHIRTLDAILSQQAALQPKMQPHEDSLEWFLQRLFDQHQKLCQAFAGLPQHQRKPLLMTVSAIEAGIKPVPRLDQVDLSKFLIPTSLLTPTSSVVESVTSSAILPLLRVLGVQNSLRLLSGLLSESRILMVSSSPTRLAQCARSALSLLAQGLLNWQHIFIPVLPPHLFQYLAAPVPYLIGMLTSLMPRLDQARADGLGEMIIINHKRRTFASTMKSSSNHHNYLTSPIRTYSLDAPLTQKSKNQKMKFRN